MKYELLTDRERDLVVATCFEKSDRLHASARVATDINRPDLADHIRAEADELSDIAKRLKRS